MWLPKEASDWSKFFIADLAYMSNSKTILPLVIFWSGHFFNFLSQKNLTFYSRKIWKGGHMTSMEASDWSKFFIADLTLLNNSKTILPLVKFGFGHYF